ncbi:MAG TPA: methyltransferase domain-containing protein [Burkholderiales bacterium]|nr:methyltransferase domain-containing protein [Burkholderiales bacterium]
MRPPRSIGRRRALLALGALPFAAAAQHSWEPPPTTDGGPFVPTPWLILDEMLKLAEIRPDDTVYDLGSGDGRLVIAAAERHGARGVGVERHRDLVLHSRTQAERRGVTDRVAFVEGDVLQADVRGATVVMMYLLPRLVVQLVPKLRTELPVGARIVSHDYPLEPWKPDKTLLFEVEEKVAISGTAETKLFFYVVPARAGGRWALEIDAPVGDGQPIPLAIEQTPDRIEGTAQLDGRSAEVRVLRLRGDEIRFALLHRGRLLEFGGRVAGNAMAGEVEAHGSRGRWSARALPE